MKKTGRKRAGSGVVRPKMGLQESGVESGVTDRNRIVNLTDEL